jgi:hypothetical protein
MPRQIFITENDRSRLGKLISNAQQRLFSAMAKEIGSYGRFRPVPRKYILKRSSISQNPPEIMIYKNKADVGFQPNRLPFSFKYFCGAVSFLSSS